MSLMRPSLKPRNLAISTGDLFCSDELNHAGGDKSGSMIIRERERETHMNNMHEEKKSRLRRNLCELRFRTEFGATGKRRSAQTDPS